MAELDVFRGVAALHERLVHAIRHSDDGNHLSQVSGIACALTLLLLGRNPALEGVVRNAAHEAARAFTPGAADTEIIALFLAGLPVQWDGEPVRELFFAHYQHPEGLLRLAELLAQYEALTAHPGSGLSNAEQVELDRRTKLKAVWIVEHLRTLPLADQIRASMPAPGSAAPEPDSENA
jgi:hypothetical protein